MGLKLFDDDNGGGGPNDVDKIEINEEFARRYKHNKEREDLQRFSELEKKGVSINLGSDSDSDDSSSSEEETEGDEKGKKKDLEFFEGLLRVKTQDPILKDKEYRLFNSESETDDESEGSDDDMDNGNENEERKGKVKKHVQKEKKKPLYLKDVTSKHLIEEGPEFDDDNGEVKEKKVKSYMQEQEELRQGVLKELEKVVDGDEEELLREKSREGRVGDDEDEEDVGFLEKVDAYFGADDKLDEDTIFLKDYFKKRLWLGNGDDKTGMGHEGLTGIDVSEDEEEIERQEDYEREYNFRFEENAGDRVIGHSRVVEGSVRKKSNTRKVQRERKEERIAQAEFERKEELKHLKNVKKKEMMEKLRKIREVAGIDEDGSWLLDEDDLEGEFDPDEYDKKMKKTFDESYYKAEDMDPDFGSENDEDGDELEKPDFDKEDDLLGLPKGWDDVNGTTDGFLAARDKILKQKKKGIDNHHEPKPEDKDEVPEDGEDGEDDKLKEKRKRKLSDVEKAVTEQLLEEFHKLEYEDTIGDLKTRFKYRAVKRKKYGLDTIDVLRMDDKELNQFVPLKKLAPYREKEWMVPRTKILQHKQKIKNPILGVSNVINSIKHEIKTNAEKSSSPVSIASGNQQVNKNSTASSPSRRAKRRRRQAQAHAELKIPATRFMAYGNIPMKSKSKKKPSVQ